MRTKHLRMTTLSMAATCLAMNASAADTLSQLSGQWWQWAFSAPAAVNPVTDDDGRYCMVGQHGNTWFLAGAFSGQPTVRTCSVPATATLFFPVINSINFNTPGCFQDSTDLSVAQLRALVAPPIDGATGLSVLLDNQPVSSVRVQSDPFPVTLPGRSVFYKNFKVRCLDPGRVYSPAVDDGYYVSLQGLSVGQHHLSIRGTDANGFSVDVFYTLNVTRVLSN